MVNTSNKLKLPVTREDLHSKPITILQKVYHTLYSKDGTNLTQKQLEDYVYEGLNTPLTDTKVNKMTENKKETFTPKEIAKEHKISPIALRKILRKNFKKPEGGNWNLSTSDVEKLLKLYQEERERAAESKSHNIERLKAAREAKKAAQAAKEAPAKEAPAKKAPAKATPAKKPAAKK